MTIYYKIQQILLQNMTVILLQNPSGFLLQNETVLLKMRMSLQNAMILLKNATVITKRDVCYKLRQYKLVVQRLQDLY